jgi:hypothetical protein
MAPNKFIHAPIVTTNYPDSRRIFIAKGHESSMTNVYLCCIHFGLELAPADDPDDAPQARSSGLSSASDKHCRTSLSIAEGIVRSGSHYRSGRFHDRLKFKSPEASAVGREAEEDWSR